jgi:hypothetical protein
MLGCSAAVLMATDVHERERDREREEKEKVVRTRRVLAKHAALFTPASIIHF